MQNFRYSDFQLFGFHLNQNSFTQVEKEQHINVLLATWIRLTGRIGSADKVYMKTEQEAYGIHNIKHQQVGF